MKFIVTLSKGEDGYVVAECPSLPGCLTQGKTKEEALANNFHLFCCSKNPRSNAWG